VKSVTVQLSAVGKLEDALSHLKRCPVDLVEKQDDRLAASGLEPVGRVPRGSLPVHDGQTDQIALCHLRSTTLHDGQTDLLCDLVDGLGFTDPVSPTDEDGLEVRNYERNDGVEGLEIDSHDVSPEKNGLKEVGGDNLSPDDM
jgi:hypothetical protein